MLYYVLHIHQSNYFCEHQNVANSPVARASGHAVGERVCTTLSWNEEPGRIVLFLIVPRLPNDLFICPASLLNRFSGGFMVAALIRCNLVHQHLVEPSTQLSRGGACAWHAALAVVSFGTILGKLRINCAPALRSALGAQTGLTVATLKAKQKWSMYSRMVVNLAQGRACLAHVTVR